MTTPDHVTLMRKQFDAELEKLEEAIDQRTVGYSGYGPVENAAMVALVTRFVETDVWRNLDHAEQQRYWDRIRYLQTRAKGLKL